MDFEKLQYPADQPEPSAPLVDPQVATSRAFYTSKLVSPEETELAFNQVFDDLTQQGYSKAYDTAVEQWEQEQNFESKMIISEVITDPTIDKLTKTKILSNYSKGGYISSDLKRKYARDLAILNNSSTLAEEDAQDLHVDLLSQNLNEDENEVSQDKDSGVLAKTGAEIASLVNLIPATIAGTTAFGYKTYLAYQQYKEKGEVDWDEIAQLAVPDDEPWYLKGSLELSLRPLAKVMGIEGEFDSSYTNKAFETVGEGFVWLAEKAAEKKIFGLKNKEQALYALEALGFVIPGGFMARKFIKGLKTPPDSPASVATNANPKSAGTLLANAAKDTTGTKAKQIGTSNEKIAQTNMLPDPDDGVPNKRVEPDINAKIDQEYSQLDSDEQVILDLLYDDNLVRKEYRIQDFERRSNITKETGLYQNTANSKYNFISTDKADILEGNMVFTQGPDYAFTSKQGALNAAEKLKDITARIIKEEKDIAATEGLGKFKSVDSVVIRDIKSGEVFTVDQLKKSNLGRRQYQVELNFRKYYDMLSDEMLGESFANQTVSMPFGLTKVATALNKTALGEYLFGTGFTAKWFERARADLGPKASRLTNQIVKEFNYLVDSNKNLRKEISWIVDSQSKYHTDHISKVRLKKAFPHLDDAQINTLDQIQTTWRQGQKTLYEITNMGEKNRLVSAGFNKGYYKNGEYKGATSKVRDNDVRNVDLEKAMVYDPEIDNYVLFERNLNRKDGYYDNQGRQLVKMEGRLKQQVRNPESKLSSDFMLVKDADLNILPQRVVPYIKGHAHKQYTGNFFVRMRPKEVIHNGIKMSGAALNDFIETKGVASTRYEAEALAAQLKREFGAEYDVLTPELGKREFLADHIDEYRISHDNQINALSRVEDMRVLEGDNVIMDPKEAFNKAANRTVRTAAYSPLDKAFKEKFMRDFKEVIDTDHFPTSLTDINPANKIGDATRLNNLAQEAKALWNRQMHFASGSVNKADALFQNLLHSVGDVFEKVKFKSGAVTARNIGNIGLTGVTGEGKRLASLMYITFQNPIRHWVIQPMMFYEQSVIFPKTFASTMKKTPIHVVNLLHEGNPLLSKDATKLIKMLPEKDRVEFMKELKAMKREGILDSIDQNLAVQEVLKGHVKKLEPTTGILPKLGEAMNNTFQGARTIFNKYGFASGELTNRVGLWLQTKERWKAANPGKKWDDARVLKEISFEAWKQSGAMTSAGALAFQRMPVLSFLTQFQSINMKGFMNILQDNATNLSRADRIKLTANRIAMHGVEYGVPLAGGKFLLDYFRESDDPEVQKYAEEMSRGYLDRFTNGMLGMVSDGKSDISISESASLGATNAYADTLESVWNVARFTAGDSSARSPNIPSVKAASRVIEKIQAVSDMFKMNEITPDLIQDSIVKLVEMTSFGTNASKAMLYYTMEDIVTNYGNKKGIGFDLTDAIMQTMGFRTRAEADQWRQNEVKRNIDSRIADEIDNFDRILRNNLNKSPEEAEASFKYIGMMIKMLEQEGVYSGTEMDRIVKGIIEKDKRRFESNETDTLISYVMSTDSKSPDINKLISLFSSHPDPVVQEWLQFVQGKPQEQLFKD